MVAHFRVKLKPGLNTLVDFFLIIVLIRMYFRGNCSYGKFNHEVYKRGMYNFTRFYDEEVYFE